MFVIEKTSLTGRVGCQYRKALAGGERDREEKGRWCVREREMGHEGIRREGIGERENRGERE